MSRRFTGRVACVFCDRRAMIDRAAVEGWLPSVGVRGRSGDINETERGCCPACSEEHIERGGDGPVVRKGHEKYMVTAAARRLALL